MEVATQSGQLESDCRQALHDLRGALIEAYAALGLDADAPQQAARRLDLNKNLAWKISKIMTAEDSLAAIQHMPGPGGLEIVLGTLSVAGAPAASIDTVRSALRTFDRVVERHAGDRADLDLMLDSMGLNGESGLDVSRELAFRGNSGIWGAQARVRITSGFVAPRRDDPTKVDTALVGGFVGFRLLRENVRWRLFRFQGFTDDGKPKPSKGYESIDHEPRIGDVFLIRKFCSPNMPEMREVIAERYREYYLPTGTVGNTGAFDCFFGNVESRLPRYAQPDDSYGQFASIITVPIETLIFDVMLHRDIKLQSPPQAFVHGRPDDMPNVVTDRNAHTLLPIQAKCVELAGRPPAVSIATVPKYNELAQMAYARLGYTAHDFRAYRCTIKHPPMNSLVLLRWDLETQS